VPPSLAHQDGAGPGRLFQTTEPFAACFPSTLSSIAAMRAEVKAVATRRGLVGTALGDVSLAVSEAATNAVVHGSHLSGATIRVTVGFDHDDMQVVVSDDGDGMRAAEGPRPGFGLRIMDTVTKDLDIATSPDGTVVHMNFGCPARSNYASLVRFGRGIARSVDPSA
jgi:anti-sigma regulatory factor (Ser/Thr protein kinase)